MAAPLSFQCKDIRTKRAEVYVLMSEKIEEGRWSHEEVTALQTNYRVQLLAKANDAGILNKAKEAGKKRLESLFQTFGFSVVELNQN